MRAELNYRHSVDCLAIADADSLPQDLVERPHDWPVMKLLDAETRNQFGWAIYSFSNLFPEGTLLEEELVPASDEAYEVSEAPGKTFTFSGLLQWAYDNLVPDEMKKSPGGRHGGSSS